jgi:hypothetical protein
MNFKKKANACARQPHNYMVSVVLMTMSSYKVECLRALKTSVRGCGPINRLPAAATQRCENGSALACVGSSATPDPDDLLPVGLNLVQSETVIFVYTLIQISNYAQLFSGSI